MNTSVINIKTDAKVKAQAQAIAKELGFSLSAVVNAYLRQFVKTKTINFSLQEEIPNEYLTQALEESKEDRLTGKVSPTFDNAEDAINWLHDPNRKLASEG